MGAFREAALRHLGARLEPDGFHRDDVDEHCIRWSRGSVFVQASFDPVRAGEVSLVVGQVDDTGRDLRAFRLHEILRLHGVENAGDFDSPQCESESMSEPVVKAMGAALANAGRRAIDGDDGEFSALERLRSQEATAYSLERALTLARNAGERALEARDYPGYVAALAPFREHLTEAEARRLEWAMKKAES